MRQPRRPLYPSVTTGNRAFVNYFHRPAQHFSSILGGARTHAAQCSIFGLAGGQDERKCRHAHALAVAAAAAAAAAAAR